MKFIFLPMMPACSPFSFCDLKPLVCIDWIWNILGETKGNWKEKEKMSVGRSNMNKTVLKHMTNYFFNCYYYIIFIAIEIINNTSWVLLLTPVTRPAEHTA